MPRLSLRAIAKQSRTRNWIAASLTLLAMTSTSYADPVTYSPENCEFSIEFPSDPYTSQRCEDGGKERCYDLVSYTQVFDLSTTVNFQVICNPTDDQSFAFYNEEIMKATLRAMGADNSLKQFETSFREETHYKQAGLVGESTSGRTDGIYIGQLWVGHNSIMSVEAELIGESHNAADNLYSEVLKSVHFKESEDEAQPEVVP